MAKRATKEREPRVWPEWPEAEILREPLREKELREPTVLVQRRSHLFLGSRGEELISLPGEPVISLFTGAGGMDIGVEQAGWCCVVQHEWDSAACETLMINRPNFFRHAALIQGDIRKTPTGMILQEGNLRVGEAAMVCGGPPCQGFSTAGKRRPDDERNDLVFEFLRVVNQARPKFFVMENVPGFLSFNKGDYLRWFLEQAYKSYYELVYGLLDAVEYGVPQYRCRFICMGTRRDLAHCDGIIASLPKPICFSHHDLDRIEEARTTLFPEVPLELLTHAPGVRYFPDRPVLVPPHPLSANRDDDADWDDWKQRSKSFIAFYDRLRREEPDRIVEAPMAG